jgi:ribosomal protein S18 acetylase RimI-like enzyme
VPRRIDKAQVRFVLETDRVWSAYALGDLAPGFFERSDWLLAGDAAALILLYHGFGTAVLFALGPPEGVRALLSRVSEERCYLSVRPEVLPVVRERYEVSRQCAMWRMELDPAQFDPAPADGAVRLTPDDAPALERLLAGAPAGEAPDFLDLAMLDGGVFYGAYEGRELVAIAGTHLVAPSESVAAVGNVYTRPDRRGRGMAARTTAAVTAELVRMGIRTIVLNVAQANEPAVRVYERLGYARYCPFYEGLGSRRPASAGAEAPL